MKIPAKAKLVFKGIIYDVYHWEQELFDGTTTTFEMLKRPNTLQVIAVQNGKILVTQEQQPGYAAATGFLGGRQEPTESTLDGAKRELLEEAGLTSNDWELLTIYNPLEKIEWEVHIFIARNVQKVAEPKLEPGEKISITPLNFAEFSDLILNGKVFSQEFVSEFRKWHISEPEKIDEFKKKLGL